MPDKDYYSFDEVLSDLRMEEDELKRLVSAGEIRAFRDQDTMRFKAADVERLKSSPGAQAGEEIELDLGDDLDLGDELDLGFSDDEELVLDDDPAPVREELDLAASPRSASGRGAAAAAPQRSTPRSQVGSAAAEGSDSPAIIAALAFGFIVLIFANFAALGAAAGQTNALTGFLADMFAS